MSTVRPSLSIPEMIKFIRYSFRESEFDEVQNALLVREKIMENKTENLVADCASLKKQIDLLEKTQSFTVLEKCSAEEKLDRTQKRCEKLDKENAEMRDAIKILRDEKVGIEGKLESSRRKCEDMEAKLVKMGKEMEDARRDKTDANKAIEELERKLKKAEANQTSIEELERKLKKAEANQTSIEEEKRRRVEGNFEKALKTVEDAKKRGKEMLDALRATQKNKKPPPSKDPVASELKLKHVEDNGCIGSANKGSNGSGIRMGGAVEVDLIVITDSDDETCIPRTNKRIRRDEGGGGDDCAKSRKCG